MSSPQKKRRKRASLNGLRLKLEAPERKGYVRRWVNDDGNRVAELYDRDYEHVEDTTIQTDGEGTRVKRRVGTKKDGSPLYSYLMEIPEKYYQEDQKEKAKPLDEFNDALKRGQVGRQAGDGLTVETVKIETS